MQLLMLLPAARTSMPSSGVGSALAGPAALATRQRSAGVRLDCSVVAGWTLPSIASRWTSSRAHLRCLAREALFCEIGKRSVWSVPRQRGSVGSTLACHTIALDADMADDPQWMHSVLVLLSQRAASGVAHSLPLQAFDLAHGFESAFRALLGGASTGKVVLRVHQPAEAPCICIRRHTAAHRRHRRSRAAHRTLALAAGGTRRGACLTHGCAAGGWRWVACCGVRSAACKLLRGCSPSAAMPPTRPRRAGFSPVRGSRCSVAVGGVWHAAGVLADGTLAQQGAASLRRVYGPKAHGVVTLQHACATSVLRSCALFSSVAALLGGAGQANYAAANCCLDSHAAWRRTGGMVGVSVQWSAWAEVGMAAGGAVHARLQASGFDLIGLAEGLAALQVATCTPGASVLAVVPARWGVVLGCSWYGARVPVGHRAAALASRIYRRAWWRLQCGWP